MSWVMKGLLAKRDVYSWALFQLWKLSSKPRQESCNVENVVKLTAMTGAGMRAMADVDTAWSWSLVRLPISAAVRPPVIINLPLLFWGQVSWTWIKHATWNGSTCAAVHKERRFDQKGFNGVRITTEASPDGVTGNCHQSMHALHSRIYKLRFYDDWAMCFV